jgi:Tfp pilus assembly protein FimV
LPVHSVHVGQDLEVHYRWHPYFGCRVRVRQIQERADRRFVRVQCPTGIIVLMVAWMLDPVACAAMTIGSPRVEGAALVELRQMLIDARLNKVSPKEAAIVQEQCNEDSQDACDTAGTPPVEPVGRLHGAH